jgi:hypothetical protein
MTIALQGQASALATSIALPSHITDDLIIIHAANPASATLPTKPSTDWITAYTASVAGGSVLVAYRHAQNNAMISGTWTNSSHLFATVWRGGSNTLVAPEFVSANTGTSVTVNYAAQAAGSVKVDSANMALLLYVLNANITNTLLPPGATIDLQAQNNGTSWQAKQYYQLNRTASWASTNVTQAASAFWRSLVLSLVETQRYGSTGGGGGSVRQVNIRGGADQ